jgi:hypothetical protein
MRRLLSSRVVGSAYPTLNALSPPAAAIAPKLHYLQNGVEPQFLDPQA